MRRKDRQAAREQAGEILEKGLYGVLSMSGGNAPYGIPLSYVFMNGCVYFHCAAAGEKLERLHADGRVSFCVVAEAVPLPAEFSMRYRSAIAAGKAGEVSDDAEKSAALIALVEKYSGKEYLRAGRDKAAAGLSRTLVFRIKIETLTGKIRA